MFDERHFSFVPKIGNDRTNKGRQNSHAPSQPNSHTHNCRTNAKTKSTTYTIPCFVGHTPSGQLPILWHNRRYSVLTEFSTVGYSSPRTAYTCSYSNCPYHWLNYYTLALAITQPALPTQDRFKLSYLLSSIALPIGTWRRYKKPHIWYAIHRVKYRLRMCFG